jgi:hypothetical protein
MSKLPANINSLINGLEKAQSQMQAAAADGEAQYIKMSKGGDWIFGAEDTDIEDGSVWAVNPNSFISGFVAWDDGELVGEEMRSILADPIAMVDLPDVGAQWKQQFGFQMACTNGEDTGMQVIYKANSKGGTKAVAGLLDEVLQRIKTNPADDAIVPLVTLDSSSYKHKKYGKVYTPVFEVESWGTLDGAMPKALEEPEPAPAKEEEPAPTTKRRRRSK